MLLVKKKAESHLTTVQVMMPSLDSTPTTGMFSTTDPRAASMACTDDKAGTAAMNSTWRKCREGRCKDKLDVLDNMRGMRTWLTTPRDGGYVVWRDQTMFRRTPEVVSAVASASVVDLGPGFAGHHDRKFLDSTQLL